jgi:hypothetical protein
MMMDMDLDMDENPVVVKVEQADEFDEDKKFEPVKRGRTRSLTKKSSDKVDIKVKLERSRQSARECRARKKLRYQYLEEIIAETEKSILLLRNELEVMKSWAKEMDEGRLPQNLIQYRTSCVNKKLTLPFQLQEHHHTQLAQQQKDDMAAAAMATQQQQMTSASSTSWNSGGICISPSSGALGFLSMSPSGQLSPQMTSSGAYSVSPS